MLSFSKTLYSWRLCKLLEESLGTQECLHFLQPKVANAWAEANHSAKSINPNKYLKAIFAFDLHCMCCIVLHVPCSDEFPGSKLSSCWGIECFLISMLHLHLGCQNDMWHVNFKGRCHVNAVRCSRYMTRQWFATVVPQWYHSGTSVTKELWEQCYIPDIA